MHEMPVGKIGTQNEVSGELSLNTHAGVQRRRSFVVCRVHPVSCLLSELDRLNRGIRVDQTLDEASPDHWQNREQVGTGEQGRIAEIQRVTNRNSGDTRQDVSKRSSGERPPAKTRRTERCPLRVETY